MALEIERRFLVRGSDWQAHRQWQARLRQGYLVSGADGLTVRVRTSQRDGHQERAWLTLKAALAVAPPQAEDALTRQEFEYAIPVADGEGLLALCPHQVLKWRYGLDLPGGDWVLDVFEDANAPLVVAEVELATATDPVVVPPWCVRELTGDHALSNAALARRPLTHWSPAERQALLTP
jgi:CYTH domain-containing protein